MGLAARPWKKLSGAYGPLLGLNSLTRAIWGFHSDPIIGVIKRDTWSLDYRVYIYVYARKRDEAGVEIWVGGPLHFHSCWGGQS